MIKTRKDLKEYLKSDFHAFDMKYPIIGRITYGENAYLFSYIKTLRYVEYYLNKKQRPWDKLFYAFYLLKHRRKSLRSGINIPPNTCGKGLFLVHPGFRRIGAYLKIGNNCTILPMVLIGKKSPTCDVSDCVIGENCYIGTGAIIMMPIKIGNNVTISAGAVVTKDVPDNAVVAGVPAQVIKFKA